MTPTIAIRRPQPATARSPFDHEEKL